MLLIACSTSPKNAYIAPYSPDHGIGERVVFLPPTVEIEIDGQGRVDTRSDAARQEVQGALEAALAREHMHGRYVFASEQDGRDAAHEAALWIRSAPICAGDPEAAEAHLPLVRDLTDELHAGAAVFVDARLHLASKTRRVSQVAAGTLIAAASVAIVALLAYTVVEGGDASGCAAASGEVAIDVSDVLAQSAIAQMQGQETARPCAQRLPLPQEDDHGFWTGNHLDLGVAVISSAGRLLWYRAGKLPLKKDDNNAARRLASFFEGMP